MRKTPTHIAICSPIQEAWGNRIFETSVKDRLIGSGWVGKLKDFWDFGDVVTGDVALEAIKAGRWDPKNVLVIQSEDSKHGTRLEELGCRRFYYICWESPLYAFRTFDRLRRKGHGYRYSNTAQANYSSSLENKLLDTQGPMLFPCLPGRQRDWRKATFEINRNNHKLDKVALIAAFKPLRPESSRCILEKEWKSIHLGAVTDIRRATSGTYLQARKLQTHTRRLAIAEHLLKADMIDIYGRGWPIRNKGTCANKSDTVRLYRFSIAFENCIWPGYHTEKLPQIIASGSVPIAILDKVTQSHVPDSCYLNADNLSSQELLEKLRTLQGAEIRSMEDSGKDFLGLTSSAQYFEDDFAEAMASRAQLYINE